MTIEDIKQAWDKKREPLSPLETHFVIYEAARLSKMVRENIYEAGAQQREISRLLAEVERLQADRQLETDIDLPAGTLTLKRESEELRAEVERLEDYRQKFLDLLAVIHRDGGQYISNSGDEKAFEDGVNNIVGAYHEVDTVSTLIAELREADRLYAVAETGEDYSNAHQAYQDALKKLFAWRVK